MKIFETAYYIDTKGVFIDSEHGKLYIDPQGNIWAGIPRPDGKNFLNKESQERAKKDILEAEYVNHKNGFEHITRLLKLTDIVEKPKEEVKEIQKEEIKKE